MDFFPYGEKEITALAQKDERLGEVMKKIGPIHRPVFPHIFPALIHSVLGQQISTKAHETIWQKAQAVYSPITPQHLAGMTVEQLRSVGISGRKAEYIHAIATSVSAGCPSLDALPTMSDEEVCSSLCALRGVGLWTAEMILTFSMLRPDVLSFGDFGIRKGLRMIYGHETLTKEQFLRYKKRFSPYGTVASLYLWAVAGGAIPELSDPADALKK